MSVMLRLQSLSHAYGDNVLLDQAELTLNDGERVSLVGRNGTGKSTLLRMLAGDIQPDSGEIHARQGLRVTLMPQEVPTGWRGSVYEVTAGGLGERGQLVARFHQLSVRAADCPSALPELEQVQHQIDATHAWDAEREVSAVLSRLELDPDADFASLSGGRKRRVALARSLAGKPDLLLLDEPTNHLDLESIQILENMLLGFTGSIVFITHDRAFLRRLANRIIELDRGRLGDYPGDYDRYLRDKQAELEAEARRDELADRKLAQEEAWIRQGIKARRTRNEGRVRALKRLRVERAERRERMGQASFNLQTAQTSGKIVIEAKGLGYAYGDQPIVRDLDLRVMRGDKIGIIGPNGVGKTTLLRLLLGQLAPQQGSVKVGTQLEIAYFDQLRAHLDPTRNARDNVAGGSDQVVVNGHSKHVISYLQDFLFSPRRAMEPITALSGGERNRLLLACLFTRPANLLVLDEPTNDLDVETLELLESLLVDYEGTLLLVSHDREFIDNVVTSTLVFEGEGRIAEYVGGYSDWQRQKPAQAAPARTQGAKPAAAAKPATATPAKPGKLSYKLQRELDGLPAEIERLEAELEKRHTEAADPGTYKQGADKAAQVNAEIARLDTELATAYARWEELEELRNG